MHDELGSGLASIGLLLQQVKQDNNNTMLEKASQQLTKQQSKIKEISHNFVPRILETHGLSVALTDLFEEIRSAGNIHLHTDMQLDDTGYVSAKSVHIYRILREILSNSIKHSGATDIKVNYRQDDKKIFIIISDNGTGFNMQKIKEHTQGLGLQNIQSRIELLHASLVLDSGINTGTTYHIRIPITSIYAQEWKLTTK